MNNGKNVNTGEVLIRLKACGISYNKNVEANRKWSCSNQSQMPSHELTGIIEHVADNVTTLSAGDHVGIPWITTNLSKKSHIHNLLKPNRLQGKATISDRYITAPASSITKLPENLSFSQAAPLLYAGLIGYAALEMADVQAGETVAILGVKGIGHMAIQFADIAGAKVIALTGSRKKINQCHELGAEDCISGQPDDLALCLKEIGGADVLISTLPAPYDLRPFINAIRKNSRMVLAGTNSEKMTIDAKQIISKGIKITGAPMGTKQNMEKILSLAAAGSIQTKTREYLFKDACEALQDLNSGKVQFRAILRS